MDAYFKKNLNDRKNNGLYRQLKEFNNLTDFSSNDYLGIAKKNATCATG